MAWRATLPSAAAQAGAWRTSGEIRQLVNTSDHASALSSHQLKQEDSISSVGIIPSHNYGSRILLKSSRTFLEAMRSWQGPPGGTVWREDLSRWFSCKKICFVSTGYRLAELASSSVVVVTWDKWPYLLCYYVQHNHARNSQRNIEPTLHWLYGSY